MKKIVILFFIIFITGCTSISPGAVRTTTVLNTKDLVKDPDHPYVYRLKSDVKRENIASGNVVQNINDEKKEPTLEKKSIIFSPVSSEILVKKEKIDESIKTNNQSDFLNSTVEKIESTNDFKPTEEHNLKKVEKSKSFYFVWYFFIAPLIMWCVLYLVRKNKQ